VGSAVKGAAAAPLQPAVAGQPDPPDDPATNCFIVVERGAGMRNMMQGRALAASFATLGRTDELLVVGAEKDGYINLQRTTATGWVKDVLVQKR
jgi:hypothetical protein